MTQPPHGTTPVSPGPFQSWAERNGFSHGGLALIWIVAVFVLFQLFASFLMVIFLLFRISGEGQALDVQQLMTQISQHLDLVFIANTLGQVLFLAIGTWLICRLHTTATDRRRYIRLKFYDNTPAMIGIIIVLMLVAQPAIWFLGWLNSLVPVPDWFESMQLQQMEMIEGYLRGDGQVWIALFNIGVVPAVCEEILFRGYVLRSFEKSWGVPAAIVVSGVVFGMFHLQLANLLPLATIGILLAVITWATRSLIPAMVAHFVNNGASVLLGKYYPETAFAELAPASMPSPWLVAASGLISIYLIYLLVNGRTNKQ